MKDNYYCNCQADCIHKGKLRKIKQFEFSKGRKIKHKFKVESCKNTKFDCTCKYRLKINKVVDFLRGFYER